MKSRTDLEGAIIVLDMELKSAPGSWRLLGRAPLGVDPEEIRRVAVKLWTGSPLSNDSDCYYYEPSSLQCRGVRKVAAKSPEQVKAPVAKSQTANSQPPIV